MVERVLVYSEERRARVITDINRILRDAKVKLNEQVDQMISELASIVSELIDESFEVIVRGLRLVRE